MAHVAFAMWVVLGAVVEPLTIQAVTATTGAVNGVVTDGTSAVVPGVTVTLTGPAAMVVRKTVTDAAGTYRFSAVPPGDYALTFELHGFEAVVRQGIVVGLGFTASVNVELRPGGVSSKVIVVGAPVIDLASTKVAVHFDSERLESLPGARDIFAVLAQTPGVAMSKPGVGGNGALALQEYTAYGLRATTGMHRNEVEGMRVGGANGANDNYFSDYASFAEIVINAVGHSAAMPVPGTLAQYVSKSGGNTYRGSVYADLQHEEWQATNIDDDQIARGVAGGPGLDARDVNRLERFRDFNADAGGYVKRDSVWWYAAYRDTEVGQRYAWLLDAPALLTSTVTTGKGTYALSPRQKIVGYLQHESFDQSSYFVSGTTQPIQTSDALPTIVFPVNVWKAEYNLALTDAIYVEARAGGYFAHTKAGSKSTAPRIADVGANTVSGGFLASERHTSRPQVNGSLNVAKTGWGGSHTFRVGGEYMIDRVIVKTQSYGHRCNCVSTLNNGMPTQVQVLLGPNVSKSSLATAAAFVDDTWRLNSWLTLTLGLRLDRYQPGLPEQEGPAGQTFQAIEPVLTFNNWGPRAGVSADLSGDGKTVLKLHYGKFWLYPGANFAAALNPNPAGWSRTSLWTDDANGNGRWDPGEEGALISASGGSTSTSLDPDIVNTHVHQATAYIEREVAPDFAIRSGVVVNALRDPYGTINVIRPLRAYAVPIAVVDPGPDGLHGSSDDGATLTAFELTPEALAEPPVNLTTNLPDAGSDYRTWEITAIRRHNTGWSLLASFTKTWSREAALAPGNAFTPNALINSTAGQDRFTTWQAKLYATVPLPLGFQVVPVVHAQSGTPFARTFVRTLNYGNATIKTEPVSAGRTSTIRLVDLRTEKGFGIGKTHLTGFFEVYNVFNANADQTLTTTSGVSWRRPTAITGPRILRIGARLKW